jgi:16S rRNA (guanine527-N7)-methyltransferase
MYLLEPLLRRVEWLQEVVDDLDLDNVEIVRGRAEEYAGRIGADAVLARAVAPLAVLAGWCLPLLRPGGELIALKGRTAAAELAEAEVALRRAGAVGWELQQVGGPLLEERTTVVRVIAGGVARPAGRTRGRGRNGRGGGRRR